MSKEIRCIHFLSRAKLVCFNEIITPQPISLPPSPHPSTKTSITTRHDKSQLAQEPAEGADPIIEPTISQVIDAGRDDLQLGALAVVIPGHQRSAISPLSTPFGSQDLLVQDPDDTRLLRVDGRDSVVEGGEVLVTEVPCLSFLSVFKGAKASLGRESIYHAQQCPCWPQLRHCPPRRASLQMMMRERPLGSRATARREATSMSVSLAMGMAEEGEGAARAESARGSAERRNLREGILTLFCGKR